jgi:hypothetical protein
MPYPLDTKYVQIAEIRAALADLSKTRSTVDPADWRASRAALVGELVKARTEFLATTSWPELPRDVPALLLPVRLEVRYAWTDGAGGVWWRWANGRSSALLVRITPDELHIDNHEPQLTPAEVEAGIRYLKSTRAARSGGAHVEAFEALARVVGSRRATYVADAVRRKEPSVQPRIPEPATARLLPEQFHVRVLVEGGTSPIVATTALVAEPLVVTPDPALHDAPPPPGTLPEELAWMTDFTAAVRSGLGLVVPLGAGSHPRIESVVVTGLRRTAGPDQAAGDLEALLAAHRQSTGLSIPVPGTPTNHTAADTPPPTGDDGLDDPLAIFRREVSLDPTGTVSLVAAEGCEGRHLSGLLGIEAETFGHAAGADATTRTLARDVRRLMRLAWEPMLASLLQPAVEPSLLAELLDLHTESVSGVGPAPLLQVGRQPYGVLPVTQWVTDTDLVDAERLVAAQLPRLVDALVSAAPPSLTGYGEDRPDTETSLLDLLMRDGAPQRLLLQALLGPQAAGAYNSGTTAGSPADPYDDWTAKTVGLLDPTGTGAAASTPATRTAPVSGQVPVTAPWVRPESGTAAAAGAKATAPPDGPTEPGLWLLAALRPELDLPVTVLTAIGRLAMLAAAEPFRWQHLVSVGAAAPESADPLAAEWNGDGLADWLAYYADQVPAANVRVAEVRQLLASLSAAVDRPGGADTVEAVLAGELGTASHRLDAWWTALATTRLLRARTKRPNGLLVGAYGVLEHLRPASTRSDGFVHAPSVPQAVAAAVLQSAHQGQHRAAGGGARGDAYAVGISSARTRGAMRLIEGLRAGQALGALLGGVLEEAILETAPSSAAGHRLVDVLRTAHPLTAGRLHPVIRGGSAVAAPQVCDGLAALEGPMPLGVLAADRPVLMGARKRVADLVDAMGDLLLTEGVHQLAQRNPARAAAAVEALAGTEVPPPLPEFVAQPTPGVAVTHRVMLIAPEPSSSTTGPRGRLAPGLDAWAADCLATVNLTTVDANGTPTSQAVTDLMADAKLHALDVIALSSDDSWGHLLDRLREAAGATSLNGTDALVAATAAIRGLLAAARPVRATDGAPLTVAGDAAALVAAWEDDVRASIDALADAIGDPTSDRDAVLAALVAADAVGSPVHWSPGDADATLASAARAAHTALAARPIGADHEITDDVSAAEALRGLSGATAWLGSTATFGTPAVPAGTDGASVDRFLFQHGQVRDGVAAVERVRDTLDLLGAPALTVTVHQAPLAAGETWAALPGRLAAGRTSFVLLASDSAPPGSRVCALVVDDWVEVVPDAELTTAIAFHYDAPTSEPPNVALLAVPDPTSESPWEDLAPYVDEALRIARMRCLTPAELTGNGVVPAMVTLQHPTPGWTPDLPIVGLTPTRGTP